MIEFGPLIDVVIEILASLVLIVGMLAVRALKKKFDIEVDEKMNARINEALERGVEFAKVKLKERGDRLGLSTKDAVVAEAANYVIAGVPNALTHFGLTPARIAEMVEARLSDKFKVD